MTNYYVEPSIGDDGNPGTSMGSGNSWATIQHAIDTIAAGAHTVYLVSAGSGNDETPTVEIDFDGASGTQSAVISFIGVNSSGVDDGTRYVIDGGSLGSGLSLFKFYSTGIFYYFKNIELNNAKDAACEFAGVADYPLLFNNVIMAGSTNAAIGTYGKGCFFIRCSFSGCGSNGFIRPYNCNFIFCTFKDNSGHGCTIYHGAVHICCIFHNNTGSGLWAETEVKPIIFGCVFDDNGADGYQCSGTGNKCFGGFVANRVTNNTIGIDNDNTAGIVFSDLNFFLNNTTVSDGPVIEGGGSLTTGTEGYTDRASDDFNLTSDATLRRTAVTLP